MLLWATKIEIKIRTLQKSLHNVTDIENENNNIKSKRVCFGNEPVKSGFSTQYTKRKWSQDYMQTFFSCKRCFAVARIQRIVSVNSFSFCIFCFCKNSNSMYTYLWWKAIYPLRMWNREKSKENIETVFNNYLAVNMKQ